MKEHIVICIDPGAPKKRDKYASTGIFVGPLSRIHRLEGTTLRINTESFDSDFSNVVEYIKNLTSKYKSAGHDVTVVMEEFVNYSFNQAANHFSKNETSQLIGAIRNAIFDLSVPVVMQSTSKIKVGFSDLRLVTLGLLLKVKNRFQYPESFGLVEQSTRHERDAYRHYLLYRKSLKYLNVLFKKR